ncbi:hypothetical protein INT46_002912 [Mucor plumbeus]|uniref:Uncharacterized protein n=1 Tax=Mucor plumbeus TaxID=97098 RepID=A0A8H7R8Q5_9FUNG|nr:hypothetical protein INT46_002912 [Mucor plumbeus]
MTALLPLKNFGDIRRSIKQVLDKPHRQSPLVSYSLTMQIPAAILVISSRQDCILDISYTTRIKWSRQKDWDLPRPLDQASLEELNWWYMNLKNWNGRSLLPITPNQTVFVDSSNIGWGCSWKAHGY